MDSSRQLPPSSPDSAAYWEAAQSGRLAAPRCDACGKLHLYPGPLCPYCGSNALKWVTLSGQGCVYSFTVVHRAPSPAFESEVPYIVAIIELDEGLHMMSRLIGASENLVIGQAVQVCFKQIGSAALPVFEVRRAASRGVG